MIPRPRDWISVFLFFAQDAGLAGVLRCLGEYFMGTSTSGGDLFPREGLRGRMGLDELRTSQ